MERLRHINKTSVILSCPSVEMKHRLALFSGRDRQEGLEDRCVYLFDSMARQTGIDREMQTHLALFLFIAFCRYCVLYELKS